MSKSVKEMISRDYSEMLEGQDNALLVSIRGIDANSTNAIRRKLQAKDIRIAVVRNALAKRVFVGTGLEPLSQVLSGASALAYGAESVVDVAREIVALLKDYPDIELKGAVLDGQLFEGQAGVTQLSKFPTREEAIADVVTLVLGPGRKLSAALKGPGAQIAGILKTIEKKLEDGEEIKKVG